MNMAIIEKQIKELDKNQIIKDVYAQQFSGKNKVIYIYIRNKYDNYLGQEQVVITYHSKNDRLRISPFKSVYYDNKEDCLFTFVYENRNKIKTIIKNNI